MLNYCWPKFATQQVYETGCKRTWWWSRRPQASRGANILWVTSYLVATENIADGDMRYLEPCWLSAWGGGIWLWGRLEVAVTASEQINNQKFRSECSVSERRRDGITFQTLDRHSLRANVPPPPPVKHEDLIQCWPNAGPASQTLAQH